MEIPNEIALKMFRPCRTGPTSRCGGDEDPRVIVWCSDDQCENDDHIRYRPCDNVWHQLPEETRIALRVAGSGAP